MYPLYGLENNVTYALKQNLKLVWPIEQIELATTKYCKHACFKTGEKIANKKMIDGISLFSGAGGLDVGAQNAGVNIIACVEMDADSAQTLRLNHEKKDTEIIEDSILNVDFTRWKKNPNLIIMGGPPCQPFSKNGYWVKNENRLIADDPRNLLGQFLRAVSECQPKGFIFENVESILHPTNKPEMDRFIEQAETLGYGCTIFKANAADFGVPQKRKRIFVFGIKSRKDPIPLPIPTHSDQTKRSYDPNLKPHVGVGNFIKKFDKDSLEEPQESAAHGTYYKELLAVPNGKNYIALSKLEDYDGRVFRSGGRFWNFLYKLHPDLPSITIAAQPGPWVGPFHWNSRRLRVPEIAAIQTFPNKYKFFGSRRSIQKQIGNAVPCMLGEKMTAHLLKYL